MTRVRLRVSQCLASELATRSDKPKITQVHNSTKCRLPSKRSGSKDAVREVYCSMIADGRPCFLHLGSKVCKSEQTNGRPDARGLETKLLSLIWVHFAISPFKKYI